MSTIDTVGVLLSSARSDQALSQRELARRAGTAQSLVARVELGQGNPTIDTVERLFSAAGFELHMRIEPIRRVDPVIEAYKRDIDRTLIRENLRRTVDERLTMNEDLSAALDELRRAARAETA
jgi:transcriptional regulator with XRE-family HTH domain